MPTKRKFLPLLRRLAALPPDEESVTLSEPELEALIGPLGPSMRTSAYWRNSVTARKNWRFDGFDADLDRSSQAVTFTRRRA